ncbi:MAG: DUF2281 domain-containing protein [Bacteroidales bacterium]|nr:DUF2281 domain-containing protein [Bacteroidales bacterium]
MTDQLINSYLFQLPESIKQEVLHYIMYLINKEDIPKQKKNVPKFGSAKGKYIMAPDFDEPLEDFKEYMR